MSTFINKIWSYVNGFNGIILILYGLFIYITDAIVYSKGSFLYLLLAFLFFFVILLFFCPFVLRSLSNIQICVKRHKNKYISDNIIKLLFFVIPLITLLLCFAANYPGGFSYDSFKQYEQVLSNQYNDWHPVIQTLFAFKLPLLLTNNWFGSIVLAQIVFLSLALGYTFYIILVHSNFLVTVISMLFILLNPHFHSISLFPWKDVSFAIGALLLTSFSLQIYFSKGEWFKKRSNIFIFILVISITTLFRHNAILFTIPLIIAVCFQLKPKKALSIVLSFLVILIVVKGPVYSVLKVEKPDERQVETLGLPMTIIGAVVAKTPEALDEETKEFAYKVAPKKVWEKNYEYGSYNSVKFNEQTNNQVIEEYGAKKVLSMMITCIKNAPRTSITALIKLTQGVYSVTDEYTDGTDIYVLKNRFDIYSSGNETLQNFFKVYNRFCFNTFEFLGILFGIIHLILITSILSKFKINKSINWKKLLFVAPMFCFNYGTTLLLTCVGDAPRFFYYTYLIAPVLLVFIYKKEERNETEATVS